MSPEEEVTYIFLAHFDSETASRQEGGTDCSGMVRIVEAGNMLEESRAQANRNVQRVRRTIRVNS